MSETDAEVTPAAMDLSGSRALPASLRSLRRPKGEGRDATLGRALRRVRWSAAVVYLAFAAFYVATWGVPLDREGLVLWLAGGLAVSCIGRHPLSLVWLAVDFLPFALVLVFYDYLRGLSGAVGMPTWWQPQIEADKLLFLGQVPTIWLQEHLKHQRFTGVRWYDVVVCLCYYSFFFLPYVTAAVMWLRSRTDFYRWSLRFVGLSFLCFVFFMLVPAAPPWAAAHCTAADVANHPSDASCMYQVGEQPDNGLLGQFSTAQPGANPWVERIAGDGLRDLHLGVARELWTKGFVRADPVAAVPSLHVGGTVLFCLFLWSRAGRSWRPLLMIYPFVMIFSLAYAGEHYVSDGIAGALAAWFVHVMAKRIERARARGRASQPEREAALLGAGADAHL